MAALNPDVGLVSLRPRVDGPTFLGIMWGGIALSLCFLIFRLFVRVKYFNRIFADDVLVLIAWTFILANAVVWQTQKSAMYAQYALGAGLIEPTPEVLATEESFLHTELAPILLFYACLWSVKFSILIFFRRLGQKVKGQKIWWWCVLGVTIASLATCVGDTEYRCLLGSLLHILSTCASPDVLHFQTATLHYNCAADVITDVMIITIPVLMLWNIRVSWKKKLALIGVFSLTIIVMIFAIVRVALVTSNTTQLDMTWLYMWSNIEMAVSIIIACLASFRQLFVKSEQSARDEQSASSFSWAARLLSSFQSLKFKGSWGGKSFFSSRDHDRHRSLPSRQNSTEHIVPLDTIYITHDVEQSSGTFRKGLQVLEATV